MRLYIFCLLTVLFFGCQPNTQEDTMSTILVKPYPTTVKQDVTDDYHGTIVADPYRWLEDDNADDTKAWVKAQNEVTYDFLNQLPGRQAIENRYKELFNYPKLSSPFRAGDNYFFYKNNGLQNQSVIYVQKGMDGEPEVFVDPNELSKDGTVTINLMGFSEDNKYVAISRSEGGSDWQQIRIMDVETKTELPDRDCCRETIHCMRRRSVLSHHFTTLKQR